MSKKKFQSIPEARHVRIYHSTMTTPAWRDMCCNARAAYIEISMRYGGKNSNNGRIPYSSRELEANLKVGRRTALRIFRELQEHGFIVMVRRRMAADRVQM